MMVIAKKKAENKTTRNVSGASDFHSSSSSSATATIESRNVINCLFITSQEILLCFFFGMLSKKTTSKARAIGIHTHHKKARNVTAERVKAKKSKYVCAPFDTVCLLVKSATIKLFFFSSTTRVREIFNFTKIIITMRCLLCMPFTTGRNLHTKWCQITEPRKPSSEIVSYFFFVCWSPSSSSSTRSNDRVNDECV